MYLFLAAAPRTCKLNPLGLQGETVSKIDDDYSVRKTKEGPGVL